MFIILTTFYQRIKRITVKELLLITLVCHSFFFILAEISNYPFALNLRSQFFLASSNSNNSASHNGFVIQLEKCLRDPNCNIRQINIADDIGPGLLFWIANKITPIKSQDAEFNSLAFSNAKSHPLLSRVIYIFIHFLFISLYVIWSSAILGKMVTLMSSLSLCVFENLFFISYSNDVYFFPIYTIILCIGLLLANHLNKSLTYYGFIGAFVGLLCWFRSSSWYIFLFFVLTFIATSFLKRKFNLHRGMLIALTCCYLFLKIPFLFFSNPYHIFWHSLHAGLFEKGGIVTVNNEFIPLHLASSKDLHGSIGSFDRWMDVVQAKIVNQKNPNTKIYSSEYEQIIKNDFFRLLKINPKKNLQFYLERIPSILSFNPFKEHLPTGEINYNPLNKVLGYLFGSFLIFFLFLKSINRSCKFLLLSILAAATAPSLVVHPNYVIYNAPILFTQWLIIFITLSSIIKKTNILKVFIYK